MFNHSVRFLLLGMLGSMVVSCSHISIPKFGFGSKSNPEPVAAEQPVAAPQTDVVKETTQPSTSTATESVQQPAVAPQVESLKESVLTLNRDLLILEEELLYPPSNQVAVYLSMDLGQFFNLDSVKLEVDGKLVSSELYSDKQIKALFRGGVQRLYVGNVKAGQHEISAFFTGRGPQLDYKRAAKLMVNKTQEPLVLELKIMDSTEQLQPTFEIKEWKAE